MFTPEWCPSDCPGRIGKRRNICRLYREKTEKYAPRSGVYKKEVEYLTNEANLLRSKGKEGIQELESWCVTFFHSWE
ncbi:hypothetical protein A3D77_05125 [Candidatus Gottesmanbacteria bacterium RIFCSPHIGHO2_02_FULL_39_11]|uniref:Uncharacterized protein n=1 Tax=Candidatus Gottesmanbacteria bacterium RIFCSPHIGHO2_02_FULL_39_11 TaxID=1798382 RepID=A0A1F5ZN16_9BACT|nr:MAG: hypothetical protein A3D77_05125 [Candidatus Gottesmanbacteria bacterium RIFCSPHIGHO2_02_FULL_39_11]